MAILIAFLAVILTLGALACWGAARRVAARSYAPLVATLAALLTGAGLCAAISFSKSGGFLAGIVGYLLAHGLAIISGGLLLGATVPLIWRRLRGNDPAASPRPAPAPWDVIGFSTLALIAVVLSAME